MMATLREERRVRGRDKRGVQGCLDHRASLMEMYPSANEGQGKAMMERRAREREKSLLTTHLKYSAVSADSAVNILHNFEKKNSLSIATLTTTANENQARHSLGYTVES